MIVVQKTTFVRRYLWVFVAGALVGDRWGWLGIAGILAIECAAAYLEGMWFAHIESKGQPK